MRNSKKKLHGVLGLLLFLLAGRGGEAASWEATVTALHLPQSSYHYAAASFGLYFGESFSGWGVELGLTPPHQIAHYRQNIFYAGLVDRALASRSFLGGYWWGGYGLGFYADRVATTEQVVDGIVPAVLVQSGVAWGQSWGVKLEMTSYVGVFNPRHISVFTVWPMTLLSGGLHVRF